MYRSPEARETSSSQASLSCYLWYTLSTLRAKDKEGLLSLSALHHAVRQLVRNDDTASTIRTGTLSTPEREAVEVLRQRLEAVDGRVSRLVPIPGPLNWMIVPLDEPLPSS